MSKIFVEWKIEKLKMKTNPNHPKFKNNIETSETIIYASLENIDKSHALVHYNIPSKDISDEDFEKIANGKFIPDEKYAVKGVDALIITMEKKESGVLLSYCDKNWNILTDSWFENIDEAKVQSEKDYPGVSSKWIQKK
jgi:hypothetical protein